MRGENGVGIAASPLTRGCDCLGEIVYLDADVSDAAGEPVHIPNAICLHEEDVGVLWRHIEWRDGRGEVRRSRRLVISSFSAIGNYDYGFFWYLYQDGTIEFEVKLTGVLSTGAVAPGVRPEHGVLVAPGAERDGASALLQHAPRSGRRRRSTTRSTRSGRESLPPGPRQPVWQRVPAAPAAARDRAGRAPAHSTAPRPAGGRSSIPRVRTGWASRSPTGWCPARTRCRSPSPTPR